MCGKDSTTAKDVVRVGVRSDGFLASEFCADCGKPVVQFLNRIEHLLIEEQRRKIENLETRMKKLEDALAI